MGRRQLSTVVRENVQSLRDKNPAFKAQRKFAKKCGIGEGTVWRIAQGQRGTTIETLQAIAGAHGLSAWQLLIDGFDPSNPPVLAPLTAAEKRLYEAMREVHQEATK